MRLLIVMSTLLLALTGCGSNKLVSCIDEPSTVKRIDGGTDYEVTRSTYKQVHGTLDSGTYYAVNENLEIVSEEIDAHLPADSMFMSEFTPSEEYYINVKYVFRNIGTESLNKNFYIYVARDSVGDTAYIRKMDVPAIEPNEEFVAELRIDLEDNQYFKVSEITNLKLIQVGKDEYINEY